MARARTEPIAAPEAAVTDKLGRVARRVRISPDELLDGSDVVARRLIGAMLLVDGVGGRIVETEAYDREDPASHSFAGPTVRNATMFGPPGRVYVYRSYGIHWCFNIVCREAGHGAGVLIRAIEPLEGVELMARRRGLPADTPGNLRRLCAGPGRLGQALGIGREHDGLRVDRPPFRLLASRGDEDVVCGPRIGITRGLDRPWRFGLAGSLFLSRPFRPASLRSTSPAG
jgi:DNA-3-methyladenine glycosylase